MGVQKIKHAASLAEWRERILACRSSGLPVLEWCKRENINVKTYYRWERLYMAEAENSLTQVRDGASVQLIQVEPALLPSVAERTSGRCSAQVSCGEQAVHSIRIQYGQASIELSTTTGVNTIAALVKALSQP